MFHLWRGFRERWRIWRQWISMPAGRGETTCGCRTAVVRWWFPDSAGLTTVSLIICVLPWLFLIVLSCGDCLRSFWIFNDYKYSVGKRDASLLTCVITKNKKFILCSTFPGPWWPSKRGVRGGTWCLLPQILLGSWIFCFYPSTPHSILSLHPLEMYCCQ